MNNKPLLGILLEFGFHEIKKYIHSGFATKLAKHFDIVWLAINKGSTEFDNYFKNTGFPLVYFRQEDFLELNLKTESRNQSVRRHWMISKNLGAFHNYNKIKRKTVKSIILGSDLLKKIYEYLTLKEIKIWYVNKRLEETLKEYKINLLLGTTYASVFSKSAFVTANKLGIKTWYLVNSWKDLYTNNFIPFDFLDGIFVWSEQMKHDYLQQMAYLDQKKIYISGNPTFDAIHTSEPFHPRSYYAQKYGISEKADWLLYTMMAPGIVNDEIETSILVSNELLKWYKPEEVIIIVRRNPNHSVSDFNDIEFPANMVLAQHYCTYDKGKDMIVQSPDGEREWIDLLHHSTLNLSVPSTVTLEFMTLNKPVLNLGLGPNGQRDDRIRQYFEAGFYKPMFENDLVMKVFHVEDLIDIIKMLLSKASLFKLDKNNDLMPDLSSDRVLKSILRN